MASRDEITLSVQTTLSAQIALSLKNITTGLDSKTLEGIVNKVAAKQAQTLVEKTFKAGSEQFNIVPTQIVGTRNPLNLVSANLGSLGLFNNLSNTVVTELAPATTRDVVADLFSEFILVITDFNTIELLNLQFSNIETILTEPVTKLVESTFKAYCDGLFSNNVSGPGSVAPQRKKLPGATIPTQSILNQALTTAENFFSSVESGALEQTLKSIDLDFSNSIANETLSQVQSFNINNEENNEKLAVTKTGFVDPSATYPTKDYANQPETNKLARGEVNGTIVQKKNNDRVIGARLPFNDAFSEPLSPFNGEYPYNKVTQTESGHVIEVDDTPGNERLHVYHKSGTYIEVDSNGSVVKRTRGSSYEIIDRNGKIAILGKADISINGACNIFVGNDVNMEVMGDVNLICHNDITAQAGGKLNLSATEEINLHSANVNIEADVALNILSDKKANLSSGEELHLKANTTAYISAEVLNLKSNTDSFISSVNYINLLGKGGTYIASDATIDLKSKTTVNIQSESDTNIKAGGNFNADGSLLFLNSGQAGSAEAADEAAEASAAKGSKVGILEGRSYAGEVEVVDPQPIRYDARYNESGEGTDLTPTELNAQKDKLVLAGIADKDELEDPNPVVIEESSVSSTQGQIILPDQKLLTATELPGNYRLSPNFTLDNMWKTVAVSPGKHVPRAQVGLTYGQIVYNLQALALNVLEPVRALYPKMIITSAFRHDQDNSKSAHPAGLACDLQFPGASKQEYYDIAVKLAKVLYYDQVLLEYWVQASNPWIHIGLAPRGEFNSNSQRKVAWTFKDHRLYKQSLVNLA